MTIEKEVLVKHPRTFNIISLTQGFNKLEEAHKKHIKAKAKKARTEVVNPDLEGVKFILCNLIKEELGTDIQPLIDNEKVKSCTHSTQISKIVFHNGFELFVKKRTNSHQYILTDENNKEVLNSIISLQAKGVNYFSTVISYEGKISKYSKGQIVH